MKTFSHEHLPRYAFFFLLLLFAFTGCFSFKESPIHFVIQDPQKAKEKKNLHAWIKLVSLPEFNSHIPKDDVNITITYSLYKFVRESGHFDKVSILYAKDTKLLDNAIILEFQFSKLEEKDKFHALYIPFGIIGLGLIRSIIDNNGGFLLYTGLGGPDSVHKIDYSGNLIAYDNTDKEKARTPLMLQTEFNSNMLYYDKATETNLKRTEMFNLAIQDILKKWSGK